MYLLSPGNKVGVRIVMVLHCHVSQFLLSSNFPMILQNSLNCCVYRQDHIGQAGNHEHLQKILISARVIRRVLGSRLEFEAIRA